MRGKKTAIENDLHSASELRAMARGDASPRKVKRLLALANALDGMSFTAAAKAAGIERQSLGDAVKRYNAEGVEGLDDRPRSGRRRKLDATQEEKLAEIVRAGPDPEKDGISAYTLEDVCAIAPDRKGASVTAGIRKVSARPGGPINAIASLISLPPPNLVRTTLLPSSCRKSLRG